MSDESALTQSELIKMQSYVDEAAKKAAKDAVDLVKREIILELREELVRRDESQQEIIGSAITKEMERWFNGIPPHEHITHHADIKSFLDAKRQAVNGLVVKGFQILITLALVASLGAHMLPAIISNKIDDKSKPPIESSSSE